LYHRWPETRWRGGNRGVREVSVAEQPPKVKAPGRGSTILVAIGFVALLVCMVALGFLAEGVREQEVFALDTLATPLLHAQASPQLDGLMNAATFVGSNFVIPPLFVVAEVWLLAIRRPREALFLALASGGSLLLNQSMKLFFERPRPQLAWAHVLPDYSFPSGHTMNSLVFYVAIAVILWSLFGRRAGLIAITIAIALSLVIGASRIYLGYHYFTDVAAGLLAGTGWLLVVGAAFRVGPLWGLWRDHAPDAVVASTGRAGADR